MTNPPTGAAVPQEEKTLALRTAAAMAAGIAFGGGQILAVDYGSRPAQTYYPPSEGDLNRIAEAEAKRARKAAKRMALLSARGKPK